MTGAPVSDPACEKQASFRAGSGDRRSAPSACRKIIFEKQSIWIEEGCDHGFVREA